jgi:hypothetical protein
MLVNNASDLQIVNTAVTQPVMQRNAYALGTDINAGSIANFTPLGSATSPLNTIFDGQGHTISNLTIKPSDSTTQNIGLFAIIDKAGLVRDLNLTSVTVNANPGVASQWIGTLAGINAGTISNVSAIGTVQAGGGSTAGGLVGQNLGTGTIAGATVPALAQACMAGQTCASVAVNVGSNSLGGGLVGSNSGAITNAFATGNVTGAAGTNGFTTLGGLAAVNLGSISNSFASGDVGSPTVANLQAGGLIGSNSGTIVSSVAHGNVQTGDASTAGGLVASNSVSGTITGSEASGNVAVASASVAGGLVGDSAGTITGSTASGAISSTGANSTVGGLVGDSTGTITDSTASGAVSSTGANSTAGGLVGTSTGTIADAAASGATSTGANSTVGGLAGVSTGTITDSTASGAVTSPPERLLRALLLQAFYTIRSETQLMEQSTITCCTAGLSGSGSTSRYGCRRCSRRTANGCWKRRLRTSSWPNF